MTQDFVATQEIVAAAHRNLSAEIWNYLVGGTESETTMRRNRLGFDLLALRPRVLVDVSKIDTSTTFLGHRLRIPVMTSPIGTLRLLTPEGNGASAAADAEFGSLPFIGSAGGEWEAAAKSAAGPKVLQLAVRGDVRWCAEQIERARAVGYVALCLTVDVARYGRRERQILDRWLPPSKRGSGLEARKFVRAMTWEKLAEIKALDVMAGMPLILKGIGTAEDAALAVERGVDVVYVSNHGGRALDHGRGSIDVLPEVVEAVKGRAVVILDGGVTRASDVVKAIALGARAVCIGKLQGWGLAAAGAAGLVRVLELLEEELVVDMALLGATSVDQISRDHICPAAAVTWPGELSAFPHLSLPGYVR